MLELSWRRLLSLSTPFEYTLKTEGGWMHFKSTLLTSYIMVSHTAIFNSTLIQHAICCSVSCSHFHCVDCSVLS